MNCTELSSSWRFVVGKEGGGWWWISGTLYHFFLTRQQKYVLCQQGSHLPTQKSFHFRFNFLSPSFCIPFICSSLLSHFHLISFSFLSNPVLQEPRHPTDLIIPYFLISFISFSEETFLLFERVTRTDDYVYYCCVSYVLFLERDPCFLAGFTTYGR